MDEKQYFTYQTPIKTENQSGFQEDYVTFNKTMQSQMEDFSTKTPNTLANTYSMNIGTTDQGSNKTRSLEE